MKSVIKTLAAKFGLDVRRFSIHDRIGVSLKPAETPEGRVLLSYILDPFLLNENDPIPNGHTNHWESLQMARTFLELGYSVDVVSYLNGRFVPQDDYSFFVGARSNFERISGLLNGDCVKIAHLDMAHWLTNNHNSYRRYLELKERRGVSLAMNCKMQEINSAIEHADCATLLGNEYDIKTYSYAGKPMYALPTPACMVYPWPESKDFQVCSRSFMWFGSHGPVHKGLDLALEAFSAMQDHHLYVCGPIHQEKDFESVYYKELYQTPNIHTMGWIDIGSPDFLKLSRNCVGLIYPSSSEAGCGAVVTCMQTGMIPVISYETGVDVHDFGMVLKECSLEEIKDSIREISGLPVSELQERARKTWEYARSTHTRENYAVEYRKAIERIMEDGRSPRGEIKNRRLTPAHVNRKGTGR